MSIFIFFLESSSLTLRSHIFMLIDFVPPQVERERNHFGSHSRDTNQTQRGGVNIDEGESVTTFTSFPRGRDEKYLQGGEKLPES